MPALRWLFYAIVIAGFGGVLAAMRDPVHLAFMRWDITLPFGLVFFLLFVFVSFFILLDRLIGQSEVFSRWRRERRLHKARALMLGGFGHLAARNTPAAQITAQEVEKLWGDAPVRDPFKLVFEGRLAEAEGDYTRARDSYVLLGKQSGAQLYALRAQLQLAQKNGDPKLLRDISRKLLKLAPNDLSVHNVYVRALADAHKWNDAHNELKRQADKNVMAEDAANQKRAELYLEQCSIAQRDGRTGDAITAARKAYKIAPTPMAAKAEIDSLMLQARPKRALDRLHKAWAQQPDDSLLTLWHQLAPAEKRFDHFEKMLQLAPTHKLTQLALVRAAIDDNRAMEARAHLDALARIDIDSYEYATGKALVVEHFDHNKTEARQWKTRADALRTTRVPSLSTSSSFKAYDPTVREPL